MFYHVKELQFNARVSKPDPRFARLLLEQFGGGNGELKAAMQYFTQAFSCKNPYPDKYDLLMDIATEEFSHLEIVGATITMLLNGVNGEMKDAVESSPLSDMMNGKAAKEDYIQEALYFPQFDVLTAGGPAVTDSNGTPWTGAYVNANSDLTVDLRSNIAAESRAKIVYEYLMKFTDDPYVKETLGFLMTREITHFQQFEAALDTIQPNFPPGVLQEDPRHGNLYFNMSQGQDAEGPWNEGTSTRTKEQWNRIDDPLDFVCRTNGLTDIAPGDSVPSNDDLRKLDEELSRTRSQEVTSATPMEDISWSTYGEEPRAKPGRARKVKEKA
ncbi:MAG: manganese catalase family protein [Rikenellaceae bacterium]|nr:manganese catalase family protein [Rikenellaceae bacterium]